MPDNSHVPDEEPNPLPFVNVKNPEIITDVRRINCLNVISCLDKADRCNWEGFHCNGCKAYSYLPVQQDYQGIAGLLRELGRISPFQTEDSKTIARLYQLNSKISGC